MRPAEPPGQAAAGKEPPMDDSGNEGRETAPTNEQMMDALRAFVVSAAKRGAMGRAAPAELEAMAEAARVVLSD